MKNHLLFFLTLILLSGCAPRQLSKSYDINKMRKVYNQSIADAAKPEPSEISDNLFPISKSTPGLEWKTIDGKDYVLVSSWKDEVKYYKNDSTGFYDTGKYIIWVTATPQLQDVCKDKKFGRKEGLDLRLKQLFGMPPTVVKKYFVEFWVQPEALYRPCPDKEINDNSCTTCFSSEYSDKVYLEWFKNQRNASYYNCTWSDNYPWTQLGYTFDWNSKNKSNVGLSEYIIAENEKIVVGNIVKTEDYCKLEEK